MSEELHEGGDAHIRENAYDDVALDTEENNREKKVEIIEGCLSETVKGDNPCMDTEMTIEDAEPVDTCRETGDADANVISPAGVERLTGGFVMTALPGLEHAKGLLEEIQQNQRVLIDTVQQENAKFDECQSFKDLGETMLKARQYYNKLLNIKREMGMLHDKSMKLKKRALKLQQQKQKEELQREQQRAKELDRERALMAKPAKRASKGDDPRPLAI